ncbi:CDP-alcohol phosphatidyltransferase family protein [Candidatus Hodarchaeum mangrovi]
MHIRIPKVKEKYDQMMDPIGILFHDYLRLTPNQISFIGFTIGLGSVILVLQNEWQLGLIIMSISLFFDGIDGNVARKYGLTSQTGEKLELIFDRSLEVLLFLAFTLVMDISIILFGLLIYSILIMTSLRDKTKFDPGMKRIVLLFGFIISFESLFHLIFLVHLCSFILQIIILDYQHTGGDIPC